MLYPSINDMIKPDFRGFFERYEVINNPSFLQIVNVERMNSYSSLYVRFCDMKQNVCLLWVLEIGFTVSSGFKLTLI